jgi:Zn-dependent protease
MLRSVNWKIVGGFTLILGLLSAALWQGDSRLVGPATLAFVLVGWVFSLCLHEFTHAATAVLAGDDSESTRRYLSFNPLHYVHPLLSIVMPLAFVLFGGIGLPGGAVYLRRDLVRSRAWQSAISLAAPLMNLLLVFLLALPLRFGLLNGHLALAAAMAFLALFEAMAGLLNLLPIPPLDGFGAIAYWLPERIRVAGYKAGFITIPLLFLLLWYVKPVNEALGNGIIGLLSAWGIDPLLVLLGQLNMFFWQHRSVSQVVLVVPSR